MPILGLEEYFGIKELNQEGYAPVLCTIESPADGLGGVDRVRRVTEAQVKKARKNIRRDERQDKLSSNKTKLESLYQNHVLVNREKGLKYLDLLRHIVNPIIEKMKESSPEFRKVYSGECYLGGSFFDGLKSDSTPPEFDLNLLFDYKALALEIYGLN